MEWKTSVLSSGATIEHDIAYTLNELKSSLLNSSLYGFSSISITTPSYPFIVNENYIKTTLYPGFSGAYTDTQVESITSPEGMYWAVLSAKTPEANERIYISNRGTTVYFLHSKSPIEYTESQIKELTTIVYTIAATDTDTD